MTPDEIRRDIRAIRNLPSSETGEFLLEIACFLGEIAAQTAEIKETMCGIDDKFDDYFTIQIAEEIKEGKR